MKKSRKIVIGLVSIVILFGLYYWYSTYNVESFFSYYDQYCEGTINHNSFICTDTFKQKCRQTGGKSFEKRECYLFPCLRDKMCMEGAGRIRGCSGLKTFCKCPIFTKWDNEQGCI